MMRRINGAPVDHSSAATRVVAHPQNGSNTMPPRWQDSAMPIGGNTPMRAVFVQYWRHTPPVHFRWLGC